MSSTVSQLAFQVLYKYRLREFSQQRYEGMYDHDPDFKIKTQHTERLSNQPKNTELRRGEHGSEPQVFGGSPPLSHGCHRCRQSPPRSFHPLTSSFNHSAILPVTWTQKHLSYIKYKFLNPYQFTLLLWTNVGDSTPFFRFIIYFVDTRTETESKAKWQEQGCYLCAYRLPNTFLKGKRT